MQDLLLVDQSPILEGECSRADRNCDPCRITQNKAEQNDRFAGIEWVPHDAVASLFRRQFI
ncbi:hypothetical protein [Mesorhizobium huakuii]|uniref:hypothetical protein n=1 Tax=Mesorhizobium huakuii TaxID=28104 RepID=UPI001FCFA871|nr:hypothetical protein [Mesorhizobium huakuii]